MFVPREAIVVFTTNQATATTPPCFDARVKTILPSTVLKRNRGATSNVVLEKNEPKGLFQRSQHD